VPDYLNEASELLTWLTITSILVGALAVVGRWLGKWLRRVIREEVETYTSLIQPTSNGGKSLPDVAAKVDRIIHHLQIGDDK